MNPTVRELADLIKGSPDEENLRLRKGVVTQVSPLLVSMGGGTPVPVDAAGVVPALNQVVWVLVAGAARLLVTTGVGSNVHSHSEYAALEHDTAHDDRFSQLGHTHAAGDVQSLNNPTAATLPSAYPSGLSRAYVGETGWPGNYGQVITVKSGPDVVQRFHDVVTNRAFHRAAYSAGDAWLGWVPEHTSFGMVGVDTRHSAWTPDETDTVALDRTGHDGKTMWGPEFKTGTTLGLPSTYYSVVTIVMWSDNSGGGIHQTAYGQNGDVWHRVGYRGEGGWRPWRAQNLADPGWTTPTLINGWTHYQGNASTSSDAFAPWQFRKTADGMVHCRGLVTGTSRTSEHLFTLPVGHRPARHYIFPGKASGAFFEWRVHSGGEIHVYSADSWISLTASWYAEQ